ncbi:hypothetical protein QBC43DRAFT_100081 [Cladorrhinum sp. PSN259]|nr:hypothetical protein QBC43DRAFT_100081 [Cladorrhinum sp. PSN259]
MSETSPPAPAPTGVEGGGLPPPPPPNLPHDSLRINIIVSAAVCWFIALIFVILRFYTRGVVIRVLGGPDWSILVSLIFAGATCGAVIVQATVGSGQHLWDLDPTATNDAIAWGKAAWYGVLFYLLTICFSKISILLLYIHLFTFKWARLAGQILLGIVIISHLYMALATFTACIPLKSYWDFRIQKKYCHPQAVWWSNTGLHMVTDFLIFMLPMPVVWSIQLPRRQKLALSGVFGFGFVVCFISILRLLQLLRAQKNPDFTYVAAELSYLTAVEVNGAIVCACVMTLKPFVVRFFPKLLSSHRSTDSRSGTDSVAAGGRAWGGARGRGRRMSDTVPSDRPFPPTMPLSPLGVLDKQYGIHRDEYHPPTGRNWNAMGGYHGRPGDLYVEIDDDKVPVVDVEMQENVPGSGRRRGGGGRERGESFGAAHDARRDYMLRKGVERGTTSIPRSGPVPEGVVRVETSVTVIKEDIR